MRYLVTLLFIVVGASAGRIKSSDIQDYIVCAYDGMLASSIEDDTGILHSFYCAPECRKAYSRMCIEEFRRLPKAGEIKYICEGRKGSDCVKQFI